MPSEKLPKSFNAAIKLMVDHALLGDRMAQAREVAAFELKDAGWSADEISSLFKRTLDEHPDMAPRHLEHIGVSRATINNAIRAYRIRNGQA